MFPLEILNTIFTCDPCTRAVTCLLNRYWYNESCRYIITDIYKAIQIGDCASVLRSSGWINSNSTVVIFKNGCPKLQNIFLRRGRRDCISIGLAYAGRLDIIDDYMDQNIINMISYACYGRQTETVKYLLQYIPEQKLGFVWNIACMCGVYPVVKNILDMNCNDIDYQVGLTLACLGGHFEIVKLLSHTVNTRCWYYIGTCGYSSIVNLMLPYANSDDLEHCLTGAYHYGRVDDFHKILGLMPGPALTFKPPGEPYMRHIIYTSYEYTNIQPMPVDQEGHKYLMTKHSL